MPYNKSTQRKYGDSPLDATKNSGYAPFKMKAASHGNNPIMKNIDAAPVKHLGSHADADHDPIEHTGATKGLHDIGAGFHTAVEELSSKISSTIGNIEAGIKKGSKQVKSDIEGAVEHVTSGDLVKNLKSIPSQIKEDLPKIGSELKSTFGPGGKLETDLEEAGSKIKSKIQSIMTGKTVMERVSKSPKLDITSKTKKSSTYTVKKGDSLSKIAKAHNTSVSDIMKNNPNIKDKNKIYVGNKIKIN